MAYLKRKIIFGNLLELCVSEEGVNRTYCKNMMTRHLYPMEFNGFQNYRICPRLPYTLDTLFCPGSQA